MLLSDLLGGLVHRCCSQKTPEQVLVEGISADSRTVVEHGLFVALSGGVTDGHHYLAAAVQAGAAAVMVDCPEKLPADLAQLDVCVVVVDRCRSILGELAARFYGQPAAGLTLLGVTGTNGKTTVSYLLEQGLRRIGRQVGVIGTVEYRYPTMDGRTIRQPAPFTTPDPLRLHHLFREMVDNGVTHVVMEVSSHALRQERLGPVRFALGLFTNLSQDHLDYHASMADYWEAKWQLFERYLAADGTALIVLPENNGSETAGWAEKMAAGCRELPVRTVTCGRSNQADYRLLQSTSTLVGSTLDFQDNRGASHRLHSPLVGDYNMDNLLAALTALTVLGVAVDEAGRVLADATGAPGRLQRVGLAERCDGQPTVLVDYAHTPDALANVLKTLAAIPHGRLFCLMGCGGDRDRGKRPLMGGIAAHYSDVVVVTDDNPRSEEPAAIRSQVLEGVRHQGMAIHPVEWLATRGKNEKGAVEVAGREAAIEAVVTTARPGDIVLLAGKGHEQYQIIGDGRRFFDDVLAAQQSSLLWDTDTLVEATGGRLLVPAEPSRQRFGLVSTDSRSCQPGDIFVALVGERHDGHDFLEKAVQAGAGCLVVSDAGRASGLGIACVAVPDTLAALGDMAHWRRQAVRRLQQPVVVGLTGSCGKTTVKEMVAAIFAARWPDRADRPAGRVLKTLGNFNNLVGLPLSLLPIGAHHRGAILEMGMNQPGEIARLASIADPDICCITNIHGAHLEGLGTIEGVAAAKGELFALADERAVLAVNLDDARVVRQAQLHPHRTLGFSADPAGRPEAAEVWVETAGVDGEGSLSLVLHVGDQRRPVVIHAAGLHNGGNAAAAAAIARAAGIEVDCIVAGLERFRAADKRMQTIKSGTGVNILNDTYNANPASMAAALATLAGMPARHRVALLGDMLELGAAAPQLHEEIGRTAAAVGIDYLGVVGSFREDIGRGARAGGMKEDQIIMLPEKERAVDWLTELVHSGRLHSGDWLLVKASRGIALDTVVSAFVESSATVKS